MHTRRSPKSTDHQPVHFYVTDDRAVRELLHWDPDLRPQMFASGVGHNLYELYARFRDAHLPVSLGPNIPENARAVVAFVDSGSAVKELRFAWSAARHRTMIVRSDAPLEWEPLLRADLMVVPNKSTLWDTRYGARCTYLPALPQRGLVPRSRERTGITTLGFKGNPENVPDYLVDPEFRREVEEAGVEMLVDTPGITDGSDQTWHDFSRVDVTLCLRRSQSIESLDRKPPTRLINSWCAGTVPFVAPEPAYLDLIDEGENGFVVHSPAQLLEVLHALRTDRVLAERVWAGVHAMQAQVSSEAILDEWIAAVGGLADEKPGRREVIGRRVTILLRGIKKTIQVARRDGRRAWSNLEAPPTRNRRGA